ncbi:MAG TPA: DUF92 domain-containing protein [Limnochordales bacterium]
MTGWAAALAAAAVSLVGWRAGALDRGGALAAAAVGGLVFAAGGLGWAALLVAFFVSGSALTAWRRRVQGGTPRRGAGRDARQVLANGGVAAAVAAWRLLGGGPPAVHDALVAGSLAAMAADTWATEVGLARGGTPVLLVGRRPVAPGQSGGVTTPGTLAGIGGAAVLAALSRAATGSSALALAVLVGGVAGMLIDSLLGAVVQGRWRCAACGRPVERPGRHLGRCPGPLTLEGGWPWLDNDAVNAVASAAGGLVALLVLKAAGP